MQSQVYKKFSLIIMSFVCLAFIMSVGWIFTGYFAPQNDTLWTSNLYRIKEVYAAVIKGPKIVIVAGSSGLYGLSAARIQQHFRIPTVNMSSHADLRDYYLYKAQKNLKPGDFVILAPEYVQYFYDSSISNVKADYIINFDKPYLKRLPLEEQYLILKTYAHPWNVIKKEIIGFGRENVDNVKFKAVSHNLNINGDVISNIGVKKRCVTPVNLAYKFDPDKYLVQKISEIIDWCQKGNITIVVSWPGTLPLKRYSSHRNTNFLDSLKVFYTDKGVECLGEPEDFFVKPSDLYDTVYHLNRTGVEKRTTRLIRFLEASPVFIDWERQYRCRFTAGVIR